MPKPSPPVEKEDPSVNIVTRENTELKSTEASKLTTADLAAAGEPRAQPDGSAHDRQRRPTRGTDATPKQDEELAALFPTEAANDFRTRWDAVQIGFVDDPARAVREADELVAQVMKSLADSFASERTRFEGEFKQDGNASTETMRVALRRYRSFFQRLLSL
jgi:hypothetical protein